MKSTIAVDRKANGTEVRGHAYELRKLATDTGFGALRLRDDGTLVVHSDEPGYRSVNQFSIAAADIAGTYVHVITDDVPGAVTASPL
jgi:hypothetical protein